MLEAFLTKNEDQQDAWFPYGRDLQRRVIPRCGHEEEEESMQMKSDENERRNRECRQRWF